MIVHICSKKDWDDAKTAEVYTGDSLASKGFIHCSLPGQVLDVANAIFKGRSDLVLVLIDEGAVTSEIKYEDAGNGTLYPHIYGPLNINAAVDVKDFPPQQDGTFTLPSLA